MIFEWDEAKSRANLKKHAVDFADVLDFAWESAHVTLDLRFDYGEEREIALGLYRGRVHVVVYTLRGTARRIISFRKATRRETDVYEKERKRP